MKQYFVTMELSGQQVPVGTLTSEDGTEAVFRYDSDYLSRSRIRPISLSLPLREEPFTPAETRRYFEGLLPEGFTRRSVAQWMHTAENDYLGILHGLGRECLGAVRISEAKELFCASYDKLGLEDVRRLAGEGAVKSAELVVDAHLSLTGASGKVGLYYDRGNDEWYLPRGTAPSTHIVKQSHVRLGGIVVNEQLALLAAQNCGLKTSSGFIINVGAGNDAEILLASERYDRIFTDTPAVTDGLPVPLRLHQEDFAQAMGISSAEKYEQPGQGYMAKMFRLLREYAQKPIEDMLGLWDTIVFHWLIGNTDGHLKNFSLLYAPDMGGISLAPAYDIVSTAVYPSCTRGMAFAIGGGRTLDEITRGSFRLAAHEVGLGEHMAMSRFDDLCEKFPSALRTAAETLSAAGLPGCETLRDRILRQGGYDRL